MQLNKTKASNCTIESLGVQEIDVYDIEVEGNHNFFANNILVHNSCYVNVDAIVDQIKKPGDTELMIDEKLRKFGNTVMQKIINKSVNEVYELTNGVELLMASKLEAVASKALWTSKKRYAMKVHSSEGVIYDPYKLKIVGLDLIKSSTPKVIRAKLKESLKVIFEEGELALRKVVTDFEAEFLTMPIENIALPRSVNDITKWIVNGNYISRTPIQVRAAFLYNKYTEKYRNQYQEITNKDKIRIVHLKMPNPIKENVFAIPVGKKLPPELGLDKYVDWATMFEKTYISPLSSITNAIDWKLKQEASLDDFFG